MLIMEYDVMMIKENHVTNADIGGPEYADVSLHGESGGYADSAVWGRVKDDSTCQK